MGMRNQINLHLLWNIFNSIEQVRNDIAYSLHQPLESFRLRCKTGNIRVLCVPDLRLIIPGGANKCVTAHDSCLQKTFSRDHA